MKTLLRVAVALVLGALIVWYAGGVRELARSAAHPNPWYLLIASVGFMVDRGLMAFKWGLLLKSRGIRVPLYYGFKVYCASSIWATFLPTTTGADAIRVFFARRENVDTGELIASVVVERALGFLASLVMGLIALFILRQHHYWDERFRPVLWAAVLLLVGGAGAFVVSLGRTTFDTFWRWMPRRLAESWLGRKVQRLHGTYTAYGADWRALTTVFGLTLVEQFFPILCIWLVAVSLDTPIGILFVAGVLPLTLLVARLPISVDGLGVYEGILIVLMGLAGVEPATAVSIALIGRVVQVLSYLPWWAVFTIETRHIKPPRVGVGYGPG